MSHDVPGLDNMVQNLRSGSEARSLTRAGAASSDPARPPPNQTSLALGRHLYQEGGFPRVKLITGSSGVLTPVISTDAKLMNRAVIC